MITYYISVKELRVDDTILFFSENGLAWNLVDPELRVAAIDGTTLQTHLGPAIISASTQFLTVRRAEAVSTTPDPKYPHSCPRCKQRCWNGFAEFEHATGRRECG